MVKKDPTREDIASIDQTAPHRRLWVSPSATVLDVPETESGGSNYLNPDGGGSCAS